MKTVTPYLIFPGCCREAMEYYAECFGGAITMLRTYADAPIDFPPSSAGRIFNSKLEAEGVAIMASDCLPDQDLPSGQNFSLFVTFTDEDEQRRVFEALSADGDVVMPLANGFGMVEDRYMVRWMLARG